MEKGTGSLSPVLLAGQGGIVGDFAGKGYRHL